MGTQSAAGPLSAMDETMPKRLQKGELGPVVDTGMAGMLDIFGMFGQIWSELQGLCGEQM